MCSKGVLKQPWIEINFLFCCCALFWKIMDVHLTPRLDDGLMGIQVIRFLPFWGKGFTQQGSPRLVSETTGAMLLQPPVQRDLRHQGISRWTSHVRERIGLFLFLEVRISFWILVLQHNSLIFTVYIPTI